MGICFSWCCHAPLHTSGVLEADCGLQAMNDELNRQENVLDAVTDHTDRTGYDIQHVSAQARKDFKVRPKRESPWP